MYGSYVSTEFKKMSRDPMMTFMVFYPIILSLIGRYLLPLVAKGSNFNIDLYADIIIVILTLLTPMIYGAIIGFSILDDRDDNILTSIRVTPLSIHQFISIRIVTVSLLSFIACVYVMWFSNVGNLRLGNILAIGALASLTTPMTGLIINALSQNKIEGFAVMKGTGIIIIFPVIALLFIDKREFFFSFAPGFWPAKAISVLVRGEGLLTLSYNQYYFVGIVYALVLNLLAYKFFLKKTNI